LPGGITNQCKQTDRASAALVLDLERRGLLEDTLVVWGGEFGRTVYCQGKLTRATTAATTTRVASRCGSPAAASSRTRHGKTDDYGYNIIEGGVHVHDLHATMLRLLGIDHEQLVYKVPRPHFRLTDVAGEVVLDLIA